MAAGHGDGDGSRAAITAAARVVPRTLGLALVVLGAAAQVPWMIDRLDGAWRSGGGAALVVTSLVSVDVIGALVGLVLATCWGRASAQPDDPVHGHMDRIGPDRFAKLTLRHAGDPLPVFSRAVLPQAIRTRSWTTAAVCVEGPRRAVQAAVIALGLLVGVAPAHAWSPALLAASIAGLAVGSIGLWALSSGAVRPGDRLSWSYTSIGPCLSGGREREIVPARWVGVVAVVVMSNVAISLRGVSDRWTHGLPAMADDERVLAMAAACAVVASTVVAFRRLPATTAPAFGAARRTEERSARRLAIGATALMAVVGLLAGLTGPSASAEPSQPLPSQPTSTSPVVVPATERSPAPSGAMSSTLSRDPGGSP